MPNVDWRTNSERINISQHENQIGGERAHALVRHPNGDESSVFITITRDGRLEVEVMPGSQVTDWVIDVDDKAVAEVADGERIV